MGPRTLATTTACIALLTLVHAAIGASLEVPGFSPGRNGTG
jgi:hypothetical protein